MSKSGKAQWHAIYKNPLPGLQVVSLPALTLNPASFLIFLYRYLFQSTTSHKRLRGVLNVETKSVWVTDPECIRIIWTSGSFGKGQFSRSEPRWHVRAQRALGMLEDERLVAEEVTRQRRIKRAEKKAERARKEREALLETLKEEGKIVTEPAKVVDLDHTSIALEDEILDQPMHDGRHDDAQVPDVLLQQDEEDLDEDDQLEETEAVPEELPDIECLQLTMQEALFLSLALDVLDIHDPDTNGILPRHSLISLFTNISHKTITSTSLRSPLSSDFLVHYAVYHHYRSLGWCVRPGIKFGIDYNLYKRGPVFGHAEFSIVIIPSPVREADDSNDDGKPWWWIHTLMRINGQVKKTVILAFVEFHEGQVKSEEMTLQDVLGKYRIREVSARRWVPAKNRDDGKNKEEAKKKKLAAKSKSSH